MKSFYAAGVCLVLAGTPACSRTDAPTAPSAPSPPPAFTSIDGSNQSLTEGELIAPSAAEHYEYRFFRVPATVAWATVTITVSWGPDWSVTPESVWTFSYPNLVTVPYAGGFGCDFIKNHPENTFLEFSGIDRRDPLAIVVESTTVGPGSVLAIVGSDCFFDDNLRYNSHVHWKVDLGPPA